MATKRPRTKAQLFAALPHDDIYPKRITGYELIMTQPTPEQLSNPLYARVRGPSGQTGVTLGRVHSLTRFVLDHGSYRLFAFVVVPNDNEPPDPITRRQYVGAFNIKHNGETFNLARYFEEFNVSDRNNYVW